MRITCPECGFNKELPPDSIPADTTTVNCPKCACRFPLADPAEQPPEPIEEVPATVSPEEQAAAPVAMRAVPKAGFWMRVVATLIDTAIILALQLSLGALIGMVGFISAGQLDGNMAILVQLFGYVLSFTYYVVFTGHGGQTPGKMALRIKVVRTDGSEIGYGRAALREIPGKFISGILLCIGYIMVAFDEQKQGLHDRMADTYVIKL